MFFRLWTRAPRTAIQSCAISPYRLFPGKPKGSIVPPLRALSRVRAPQPAVAIAVDEIQQKSDGEPDAEPFPRMGWEPDHYVDAGRRPDKRHDPDERHHEGTRTRRILV